MAKKSLGRQQMSMHLMYAGDELGKVGVYAGGRIGIPLAIAQVNPPLFYVLSDTGHGVQPYPERVLENDEKYEALDRIKARWGIKLQYPFKKGERWIDRKSGGYTAYECTSDYKTPKSAKHKRSVVLDRAQIRRDEEARLDRLHRHKAIVLPAPSYEVEEEVLDSGAIVDSLWAPRRGRLAPPMHGGSARKSTKASRARKAMPFGFSSRVLGMTFVYYGKTYKIKKLNARATKNQVDTTVIGESQSVVHQFDADQVKRALTKAGKSWKA
jgi:hypothetical protein